MSVQTKAEVLSLLQQHQQELQVFGVERCGLFGSFVKDTMIQPDSDVDILITFEPDKKTFDNFMYLADYLENLFGRDMDLITTESLSPYIWPSILAEVEYIPIDS